MPKEISILILVLVGLCCVSCKDRSVSRTPTADKSGGNKGTIAKFNAKDIVGHWSLQVTNWSKQNTNKSAIQLFDVQLREDGYSLWNSTLIMEGITRRFREEAAWRVVDDTIHFTTTNSNLRKLEQPPEEETYKLLSLTPDEFSYQGEKKVWVYKRVR